MIKEAVKVTKNGATNEEMNELCRKLAKFECRAYIEMTNQRINAKSLMGLIAFDFSAGDEITLRAEGREEEEAIKALKGFFC